MSPAHPTRLDGYQASLDAAAFFRPAQPGCLQFSGEDRLGFLQRQSTNDLRSLTAQRSLLTVLTTPSARIIDVLRLLDRGETMLALTLPGFAENSARYLKSRIFFMDKVRLEETSASFCQIDLEGPQAGQALAALGLGCAAQVDMAAAHVWQGQPITVICQPGLSGLGYRLLGPAALSEALENALLSGNVTRLSEAAYHTRRVEAGQPWAAQELSGEYTPLETGLESAVSHTKGCYTGQEVIARQVTYDKITQRLVGLKLQQPAQAGERLWAEERLVGQLTSVVESPRFGALGLAVVKRPFFEPGSLVRVGPALESASPAVIASLPFQAQAGTHS